ncbi:MAG: hypothetical protein ABW056_11005 [Thermoanaerobaculia bacterium]
MRFVVRAFSIAILLGAAASRALHGQEPAPAPTPPPAESPVETPPPVTETAPAAAPLTAPAPPPIPAARLHDSATVAISKLPTENPYGSVLDVPAALPPKLPFTDAVLSTGFFVSVRVDPTGKAISVRRDRDPIPSLAAESMRSIQRWTITPARRSGQAVETWGAYRLELTVEIDSPKVTQATLTPVTPQTPLPAPFAWPPDTEWLESRKPGPTPEGTVSLLEVDTAPVPTKTPWSADTFKGPFSGRWWIKVDKNGRIERAIPLEVTDPVFLAYFRRAMSSWVLRPAQVKGAPVESWNELAMSGTISFDDEIKQIQALRRAIGP